MKHKKIMSIAMASAMLLTCVPSSISSVFAKSADSSIQVTSETSSKDDINVDSSSDISVTDGDSDIKVTPKESTEDITVEDKVDDTKTTSESTEATDNANTEATEDVTIEEKFTASVENKTKEELSKGDTAKFHVKAENKSADATSLKLYFSDTDTQLTTDKMQWSGYLTKPAMSMSIKGLNKECMLSVPVKTQDDKTIDTSLKFLKEVKNDVVVSRYAVVELPAGASTEFDIMIANTNASSVSVIPVMEQKSVSFGDAATLTWKNDDGITIMDKIANTITTEKSDADDIQISEVQGAEKTVDDVDKSDFASKRLVAVADDKSVFTDADKIIGQYDNIYLLQYDTVKDTKDAYARLKDSVTAVEPDKDVTAATKATAEESTETASTETAETSTDADTSNAIDALNEMDASESAQKEKGVIALIDTGVSKSENVIDSVSMIDDTLAGGVHGHQMLSDILSQDADAKVLSIRAMNDNGSGKISSLVAAMEYAIDQKVDYINLSLYARTTLATSVLEQEIMKATKAGIVVIGAAGNNGADVKDYLPGSVMEAYIIGAAKADGTRQMTSNFGDTVDYNVVADSTSDATALFTGYASKNGLDNVSSVLNNGLIYATNYTNVREPIKDTGEVFPVELSAEGNIRFVFSNLDGSLVKEEKLSNETKTVDVPMTGCHVDVIANDIEALSDVSVVDDTGADITDVTVQRDIPDWMKGVRNTFFTLDSMQKMKISAKSEDMGEEMPMFDEIAQTTYFESLLCGENCLEEHVRKGNYGMELDNPLSDDDVRVAGVGATGSCEIWFDANPGGDWHNAGTFTVEFQSGELDGKTESDWTCLNHGKANPGHNGNPTIPVYYGDYEVTGASDNIDGSVTYYVEVTTLTSTGAPAFASGYQNIGGYITVPPEKGGLSVWKYSSEPNLTNDNDNYSLVGAEFDVYEEDGTYVQTITTSTTEWYDGQLYGVASTADDALVAGRYYVQEASAPPGYHVNTEEAWVTVVAGEDSRTNYTYFADLPITGSITVKKESTLPDITNKNKCYSFEGAEYSVYTTRNGDSLSGYVGKVTIDANGSGRLDGLAMRTYYVQETKLPDNKSYGWDRTIYPVTVSSQTLTPTVTSKEKPENDPAAFTITKKQNGKKTETIPTLNGTQFTVAYYDGYYTKDNLPSSPTRTWVVGLQYDDVSKTYFASLDDKWIVPKDSHGTVSSPLYKDGHGTTVLPLGTYVSWESQAAPGYTLEGDLFMEGNNTVYHPKDKLFQQVTKKGDAVIISGSNVHKAENKPKPSDIKIVKYKADGKTPLAGVTYELKDSEGNVVGKSQTTDDKGIVHFTELYPDVYTVTELSTPEGYQLLKEPIKVKCPMRVTKEDMATLGIDESKVTYDPADDIYYVFSQTFNVSNDWHFDMPYSGAMITAKRFIPIACGMVVLMGATCVMFFKKKKKRS